MLDLCRQLTTVHFSGKTTLCVDLCRKFDSIKPFTKLFLWIRYTETCFVFQLCTQMISNADIPIKHNISLLWINLASALSLKSTWQQTISNRSQQAATFWSLLTIFWANWKSAVHCCWIYLSVRCCCCYYWQSANNQSCFKDCRVIFTRAASFSLKATLCLNRRFEPQCVPSREFHMYYMFIIYAEIWCAGIWSCFDLQATVHKSQTLRVDFTHNGHARLCKCMSQHYATAKTSMEQYTVFSRLNLIRDMAPIPNHCRLSRHRCFTRCWWQISIIHRCRKWSDYDCLSVFVKWMICLFGNLLLNFSQTVNFLFALLLCRAVTINSF